MRIIKLKKQNVNPFLEILAEQAELWAPVKKGDKHVFSPVANFSQVDLNYARTLLPPKKLFLPPELNMFTVSSGTYREDFSHITRRILFGIHPCDIHGLLILDNFFSQAYEDPYYLKARKNAIIIGHSCWPDEHCFAKFTNSHIIEEGYDLFFSDLEKFYLVWVGSSQGDDLVRLKPELFDLSVDDRDIQSFNDWQKKRINAYKMEINFIFLRDMMELKYRDPLWDKLGEACLACGSCSNTCPTCTCYNVMDKEYLGKRPAEIARCWDACTLEEYSAVAGGENFREKRSTRLKLWYTHKLQAFGSRYGKPSCVGCGRCIETCPVEINVKTVGKSLLGEEMDTFWKRHFKEVAK